MHWRRTGSRSIQAGSVAFQKLVYFSWFARKVPSIAVNGWYSTAGTLIAPTATLLLIKAQQEGTAISLRGLQWLAVAAHCE